MNMGVDLVHGTADEISAYGDGHKTGWEAGYKAGQAMMGEKLAQDSVKERRESVAKAALTGALSMMARVDVISVDPVAMAKSAITCADALIAELDKP